MSSTASRAIALPPGVLRGHVHERPLTRLPSGSDVFDRLLEGGFPRGCVSELFGPPSSGKTSLALRMIATAIARGETTALVDPADAFDPVHAAERGVPIERLIWVRPPGIREALRILETLLDTRGVGLVVLDLDRPLPPRVESAWRRLGRKASVSGGTLIVLSPERTTAGAARLVLSVSSNRFLWPTHELRIPLFEGIESRARVVRARGASREVEAVLRDE